MKKILLIVIILVVAAISSSIFLHEVEKSNPYVLMIEENNINPENIEYENLYQVSYRDIYETVSCEGIFKEDECLVFTKLVSKEIAEKYSVGQYIENCTDQYLLDENHMAENVHILKIEDSSDKSEVTYIISGDIFFSIKIDVEKIDCITENTEFIGYINGNEFFCELYSIGEKVENGKIEVRLVLHDKTAAIFPGEIINVEFVASEKRNVICIPQSCINTDLIGNTSIYKYNGETYEFKYIEIGISDETYVEVVNGLSDGDVIIDND